MFDAAARTVELEAIYDEGDGGNWAPIKEIATGLGITKPVDGWEAAIALIVEAEAAQANEIQKPVSQPPPEITPWRKPRTDLYGNLIPNPWQS